MELEQALAQTTLPVVAIPLRLWAGPVVPLVGREATFGARLGISVIQLHYFDAIGPEVTPQNGLLVSNRLRPTTWTAPGTRQVHGLENPLAAHLENFVARFIGIDPRPPLERGAFTTLGATVPRPSMTASRHTTLPLDVVEFSLDVTGPMGIEVCVAAWKLQVSEFIDTLEPLTVETARLVEGRRRT